ncbi:transcription factor MYB56 [Cajanus cajan]|nr:transcription factor MYB56 [Cajanus cajan]
MLLALHNLKGNKWTAIARFFPGKTDNSVKNHFHVLMARRERERLALFGDSFDHNSQISFNFIKNKALFDKLPTPWTSFSGSSTITSSAREKVPLFDNYLELDHFSSYSSPSSVGSSILDSYHSFTAPGLPSVGKVVPLPQKISNYGCDHKTKDTIKSCKRGKHARDRSMTLCKLSTNEQEPLDDLKQKGVSFIDFLGVGISISDDSIRGP